ncbi:hypothetical protein B0H14DRAFT_2928276, partial [Mycena olivaceomarginata]
MKVPVTRRCSSAFSGPCMTSTSTSCAGTRITSPSSDICRCARGTCYLTRQVRGRNRSCGGIRTTPYATATPRCTASPTRTSTFPCRRARPTPQRTRAPPRTHLRVRPALGPASPTRVPRRRPCPPLPRRQPAAGAHSLRAPQILRLRMPKMSSEEKHAGEEG